MKETIIADTGFWIALFNKHDKNHLSAKNSFKPLSLKYRICVSDFIIFETMTYLNCSVKRHDSAVLFLRKIQQIGFTVFVVDETIKSDALDLFIRYSDKDFSVTDCTSFVIMQQNGIQKYAGFDSHFQQMGFICVSESI